MLYAQHNFQSAEIRDLRSRSGDHERSRAPDAHSVIQPLLQKGNRTASAGIKRYADSGCHQNAQSLVSSAADSGERRTS